MSFTRLKKTMPSNFLWSSGCFSELLKTSHFSWEQNPLPTPRLTGPWVLGRSQSQCKAPRWASLRAAEFGPCDVAWRKCCRFGWQNHRRTSDQRSMKCCDIVTDFGSLGIYDCGSAPLVEKQGRKAEKLPPPPENGDRINNLYMYTSALQGVVIER